MRATRLPDITGCCWCQVHAPYASAPIACAHPWFVGLYQISQSHISAIVVSPLFVWFASRDWWGIYNLGLEDWDLRGCLFLPLIFGCCLGFGHWSSLLCFFLSLLLDCCFFLIEQFFQYKNCNFLQCSLLLL